MRTRASKQPSPSNGRINPTSNTDTPGSLGGPLDDAGHRAKRVKIDNDSSPASVRSISKKATEKHSAARNRYGDYGRNSSDEDGNASRPFHISPPTQDERDLSSAPSDPTELATWVAQRVEMACLKTTREMEDSYKGRVSGTHGRPTHSRQDQLQNLSGPVFTSGWSRKVMSSNPDMDRETVLIAGLLARTFVGLGRIKRNANAQDGNGDLLAKLKDSKTDERQVLDAFQLLASNSEFVLASKALLAATSLRDEFDGLAVTNDQPDFQNNPIDDTSRKASPGEKMTYGSTSPDRARTKRDLHSALQDVKVLQNADALMSISRNGDFNEAEPQVLREHIDALLSLADAADGEDDTESNGEDGDTEVADDSIEVSPEEAAEITQTLEAVVAQLIEAAETTENGTFTDAQLQQAEEQAITGPYGANRDTEARKRCRTILSKIDEMRTASVNTIMPAPKSRALSSLYHRLTRRLNSDGPILPGPSGIDPAHAHHYGGTQEMNQRYPPRPDHSSVSAPYQPRPGFLTSGHHAKPMSEREAYLVKALGYPPKPGQKMVVPRLPEGSYRAHLARSGSAPNGQHLHRAQAPSNGSTRPVNGSLVQSGHANTATANGGPGSQVVNTKREVNLNSNFSG